MAFKGEKMKNLTQFLVTTAPDWVRDSFPIIRIVLVCIIGVCAVAMIITTLMQSNANEDGNNALTGGVQESYYAQNKSESKNVRLSRATIILVSTMAVCMVLFFVSLIFYQG